MPEVLTVQEASDRLRVSPVKIRDLVRRGILAGLRDGRVIRISRRSLDEMLGLRQPETEAARYRRRTGA